MKEGDKDRGLREAVLGENGFGYFILFMLVVRLVGWVFGIHGILGVVLQGPHEGIAGFAHQRMF